MNSFLLAKEEIESAMPGCFKFELIKRSKTKRGQCEGLDENFSFMLREKGRSCYHTDIHERIEFF